MSSILQSSTSNLLVRALSPDDYALIEPHLERAALPLRTVLVEADTPVDRVHFIEQGVASVITDQEGGEAFEFGLIRHDGMAGMAVVFGASRSPHRSFIQVGDAVSLHLSAASLLDACGRSSTLRDLLLRYVHTLVVQTTATASANAHYELAERLARWLLMCHDRITGDRTELTHEFLAQMLAVRRSGVTVMLHTLEGTGAIRSTRGLVTLLDRARLAEIAGDSYGTPEREYNRLIAPLGKN